MARTASGGGPASTTWSCGTTGSLLYATQLPPGATTTRVRCRATTPGTFSLGPARAEEMYAPEVFGTVGGGTFEVTQPGR